MVSEALALLGLFVTLGLGIAFGAARDEVEFLKSLLPKGGDA